MFDDPAGLLAAYPLMAFALAFAAGVVSSASPCALATLPLVVGYVGGRDDGNRRRAFGYSLLFVAGLSLTFTALGAVAALLGQLLGNLGGVWYAALGLLAAAMGLHLLGWLPLPRIAAPHWQHRVDGPMGALLLGALFGVVSSPCATPVLVAVLSLVATQEEIVYGTSLLFVYALGHCVLMLAAGTFAGLVQAWSRSRGMMAFSTRMKQIFGVLLIATGGYFVWQGDTSLIYTAEVQYGAADEPTDANEWLMREGFVGLKGNWGQARLGRVTVPYKGIYAAIDPWTDHVSQARQGGRQGASALNANYFNNTAEYVSPKLGDLVNLSGWVSKQFDDENTTTTGFLHNAGSLTQYKGGSAYGLGAKIEKGPWLASLDWVEFDADAISTTPPVYRRLANDAAYKLTGRYKAQAWSVAAHYEDAEDIGLGKNYYLNGIYVIDKLSLIGTYGVNEDGLCNLFSVNVCQRGHDAGVTG